MEWRWRNRRSGGPVQPEAERIYIIYLFEGANTHKNNSIIMVEHIGNEDGTRGGDTFGAEYIGVFRSICTRGKWAKK